MRIALVLAGLVLAGCVIPPTTYLELKYDPESCPDERTEYTALVNEGLPSWHEDVRTAKRALDACLRANSTVVEKSASGGIVWPWNMLDGFKDD